MEVGYKSENKEHDFWVTAIHLGDWLYQIPIGSALCSEQQLRRLHRDHYPEWVPKSTDHRPDGWWNINCGRPNNKSLIALEVELSRKSPIKIPNCRRVLFHHCHPLPSPLGCSSEIRYGIYSSALNEWLKKQCRRAKLSFA